MPKRLMHPIRNWRNLREEERLQIRNIIVVVTPFVLILLIAIYALLSTFTKPLRAEAPFVFSAPSYTPLVSDVCPGDVLEWPVAFDVRRAPVMVISVRSVWDVKGNQTASVDGQPVGSALSFVNYTEITHVNRTSQMVVPALPPGNYQVRSAAQEFNSQAAAYSVPFVIKAICPPVETK